MAAIRQQFALNAKRASNPSAETGTRFSYRSESLADKGLTPILSPFLLVFIVPFLLQSDRYDIVKRFLNRPVFALTKRATQGWGATGE